MRQLFAPDYHKLQTIPRERRILALVGNTQVGLWVVRSLGRQGLAVFTICTAENGLAAYSRFSSGTWILNQGPDSPLFIDELKNLAQEVDAGSIMTIAEGYHKALIAHRDEFEPDIHLFCPPAECFNKAIDKDYMHQLCLDLNVAVARGTTLDSLIAKIQNTTNTDTTLSLHYPMVLRTRNQNVGLEKTAPWKAAYAVDETQLLKLYEQVKDRAENIIVQEYHSGVEEHIQILMHQGQPIMIGDYVGEHHMPLAGGVTVQRITCHHPRLIDDAVKLLQSLNWQGIAACQFHYDPKTEDYIFLEINPRFAGGLPTVIMGGCDGPFLLWQTHFEPDKIAQPNYKLGLRTRILGGDANWVLAMIRGDELPPGQKHLGKLSAIIRFLWNCGPWTKDDVFMWSDRKPFWIDFKNMLARLGNKSVDIVGNDETNDKNSK